MSRTKNRRATVQKGIPEGANLGRVAMIARQVAIQAQDERDQALAEKDLANTYLAAVLYEYGADTDGVLVSKATMETLQGQTFGIEKASDKDGLSLRVVLQPVIEAEEVLDEIAIDPVLDDRAPA